MCGICGLYHFQSDRRADPATVQAMARAISHRGPDDEGFYFSGSLGLGFRRLSIIDLAGGHQPMSDADETICNAFGVIQPKKLYGREYIGIVRSTYLIDPEGVIRQSWQPVKVPGHAQAVLDALKALKRQ